MMRSGCIKGLLVVFTVAFTVLNLVSIKKEVYTHSERLQSARNNESIRGRGILKRMDKMEDDMERLSKSKSKFKIQIEWSL